MGFSLLKIEEEKKEVTKWFFFGAKKGSSAHVHWIKAKFFHFLLREVFFEFLFQHTNINYKFLEAIPLEIILTI